MTRRKSLSVLFLLCVLFLPGSLHAENFADTNAGKAATETLKAMSWLLDDWSEIHALPLEQKIKVVQEKARERIWEKMKEQQVGVAKEAVTQYAKEKIKQELLREATARMMHQCVVEGRSVSAVWSSIHADMSSKLDTGMRAFGVAIDAAEISYSAYQELSKGDMSKALRAVGEGVAEKILEYVVPGWGYYRLAQSLVKSLGEYVMQYAFDTAFEGKMSQILPYNPKTQPEQFARWIMSINNIPAFVQREWDEQLAWGGLYAKYDGDSKTKDEFGEGMLNRITEALEKFKKDVAEKQRIEEEIRARYEEQDRIVRDAERAIRDAARAQMQQIEESLKPLKMYEERIAVAVKEDVEEAIEAQQKEFVEATESASSTTLTYKPMNRKAIVDALWVAYEQVGEMYASGYDYDVMYNYHRLADSLQTEEINKVREQITEAESIPGLSRAVIDRHYARDFALLQMKKKLPAAEAAIRFSRMLPVLLTGISDIQTTIDDAEKEFLLQLKAFDDALATLHKGDVASLEDSYLSSSGLPPINLTSPDRVLEMISFLRSEMRYWQEDASRASAVEGLREKAYRDYEAAYSSSKTRFESLVAAHNREMGPRRGSAYEQSWRVRISDFSGTNALKGEVSVKLPWINFQSYERPNLSAQYNKKFKALQDDLNQLEPYEGMSHLAMNFWRIFGDIGEIPTHEGVNIEALSQRKGDMHGIAVNPDDSDAADVIAKLKKAWNENGEAVLELERIRNNFIKAAGNFTFRYMDPRRSSVLDQYLKIPERIKEYEQALSKAKEQRPNVLESVSRNLEVYREHFKKYSALPDFREQLPLIERLHERVAFQVRNNVSYNPGALSPEQRIPFDEMEKFSGTIDEYIKRIRENIRLGIVSSDPTHYLPPVPRIETAQVQSLYQDFINAYGRGDLRGLLRLLAADWQGGDGSDIRDVENYLNNSFRMFERIQYRISGFSAQSSGENVRVSYSVHIVGENRRMKLKHEEKVQVVEEVGLVNGEPRILRTISGSQWLRL